MLRDFGRNYNRKTSADVQVRITKTVVEIPVERAGIGTVVPIAAKPDNRQEARPKSLYILWNIKAKAFGGGIPHAPLKGV